MAKAKKSGAGGATRDAIVIYVSPDGNNRWSGTRRQPNGKTTDGPVATVAAALRAARKLKGSGELDRPVRIVLEPGTHFIDKPIRLTHLDSGVGEAGNLHRQQFEEHFVEIVGDEAGETIVSGGRPITGWAESTEDGRRAWTAKVPAVKKGTWQFKELFVNGRRAARTRLPKEGLYRIDAVPDVTPETKWNLGQTCFVYADGHVKPWHNLQDVEVVVCHRWVESRVMVRAVDESKRMVEFDRASRYVLMDEHFEDKRQPAQYYIENVREALAEPGQWYLDRVDGTVTYLPRDDERLDEAEFVAPVQTRLVELEGSADKPVVRVRLKNLTFAHAHWQYPIDLASSNQASNQICGAISMRHAHRCQMVDCRIAHVSTYAVELIEGCRDCTISGTLMDDLGAGGIKVWHGTEHTTIEDCEIGPGGLIYHSAVGVLVGQSSGNVIVHNHIHHLFYTGISLGWMWGYGGQRSYGNIVEYNHVHDIGQGMLSDMGGLYTLGVGTGTRVRHNVFHDINCREYGGWGIYTDEGSTDILIEGNLIYRCNSAPFHQHYGRDNVLRNNILAYGKLGQIERSEIETHNSFTVERNIIYFEEGAALGRKWEHPAATFRNNLYYNPTTEKLDFGGTRSFAQWQALGQDEGSLIADPKFRGPRRGDFTMKKGSAAERIGFRVLEVDKAGNTNPKNTFRKNG